MIVGNGLVAKAFKNSSYNFENCIIFASGVSDSKLEDKKEFQREFELIKKYIAENKKFIYFSSIHILDPSEQNSMYVKHKIKVENFIKNNFQSYIIYRLPIIVGKGGNDKSLFNFLHDSITNKIKMNIFVDSYRYILDVKNLVYLTNKTLLLRNKVINLVFDKPFNIIEIVKSFEDALNIEAIYDEHPGGDFFKVDNSELRKNISSDNDLKKFVSLDYLREIIYQFYIIEEKYV